MFEKEEKELEKIQHLYSELSIPEDRADIEIMKGIHRAKKKKKNKLRIYSSLIAASFFLTGFVTTVKVSETTAAYIANVPGMENVVKLIRNDRGLMAVVENDYIQKIGVTDYHDGIKVELDSVIHDEKNIVMYYRYQTDDINLEVFPLEIKLRNQNGTEIPNIDATGSVWTKDKESLLEVRFDLSKGNKLPDELMLEFEFRHMSAEKINGYWQLPFTLDPTKFAEKKVVQIDKTVSVENQEITINKLAMYPSQTAVHVTFSSQNSKKIFDFNDLHLVDENGGIWKSNGQKPTHVNENESVFYLESNYFYNSKYLNLKFSSLRALDKSELWVEIDPENLEIKKAPKDGKISKVDNYNGNELSIRLEAKPHVFKEEIFGTVVDQLGKEFPPLGMSYSMSDGYVSYLMPYSSSEVVGPIKLELKDYPSNIVADKEIILKLK